MIMLSQIVKIIDKLASTQIHHDLLLTKTKIHGLFYLWVSHRYTCEHPWVTCTCAMPYHPQTTQWLIQYYTCPYGLTGQQKSTETWASAPSHLHPPTPITHCPSPPSPCQMMMWQPSNAPPQLLCPPHLTHPPSPCLQTPLHLHTYLHNAHTHELHPHC